MSFLGPKVQSVIERCPYYRGVRKERLDCISNKKGHFLTFCSPMVTFLYQNNEPTLRDFAASQKKKIKECLGEDCLGDEHTWNSQLFSSSKDSHVQHVGKRELYLS